MDFPAGGWVGITGSGWPTGGIEWAQGRPHNVPWQGPQYGWDPNYQLTVQDRMRQGGIHSAIAPEFRQWAQSVGWKNVAPHALQSMIKTARGGYMPDRYAHVSPELYAQYSPQEQHLYDALRTLSSDYAPLAQQRLDVASMRRGRGTPGFDRQAFQQALQMQR